jgi:hypothetical protein
MLNATHPTLDKLAGSLFSRSRRSPTSDARISAATRAV